MGVTVERNVPSEPSLEDQEMACFSAKCALSTPPTEHEDKVVLAVDVCLKQASMASDQEVRTHVSDYLATQPLWFRDAKMLAQDCKDSYLQEHVDSISICCECSPHCTVQAGARLLFWQVEFAIHVFQLSEEGAGEADDGVEDNVHTYKDYELPAREFHGLWDSLIYDGDIKQRLMTYAATALLFSDRQVDQQLVSFNRTALLHGPAGTGKTSMCKALAQHLSIRFQDRYKHSQLIEVNAHSLFSKYFSESGKLVSKLFAKIQEQVEESDTLVFVLIDEVESLTAARQNTVAGNEPTDAIRAVNALLTQLDALKGHANVMILTTSNITEAIDLAFVDRADIKAFIGPPSWQARYEILRSCIVELQRTRILAPSGHPFVGFAEAMKDCVLLDPHQDHEQAAVTTKANSITATSELLSAALESDGLSGRTLRKLPFLAYAGLHLPQSRPCPPLAFASALKQAVVREYRERNMLRSIDKVD